MSEACEFPKMNATSEAIRKIFRDSKTIAIVGLSEKPDRPSYHVAQYLQEHGYKIIPVNPAVQTVLGEKSYASLRDIPEKIDVVDVFRKPEALPEITAEAITVGAKVLWMQEGIEHNDSAQKAKAAGLEVVMNKCMLKEHMKSI